RPGVLRRHRHLPGQGGRDPHRDHRGGRRGRAAGRQDQLDIAGGARPDQGARGRHGRAAHAGRRRGAGHPGSPVSVARRLMPQKNTDADIGVRAGGKVLAPCLPVAARAAVLPWAAAYFLRAAMDFSASSTRSSPMRDFHLSYTGLVAFTNSACWASLSEVTVTPWPSISLSREGSSGVTPLRAMAISFLPASSAASRTILRSCSDHDCHTSRFTTNTSGSAT